MNIVIQPEKELLQALLTRPTLPDSQLELSISSIFKEVRKRGDAAIAELTERFDKVALTNFRVPESAFQQAENVLSDSLKLAIRTAASNIETFHRSQIEEGKMIQTSPGVSCWRKSIPVQSVGLYIPGGSAPLFSTVLMLGIPAKIAGCPQRVLCTPPAGDGSVNPAILYAAKIAGIDEVYTIGGAQAIAAMTFGTDTIPKVVKLFGPGNQYVTAAKRLAQNYGVAIDLPAGPSEVLVAADDSICAEFVAADLLAQAEHGADSQVVFLTDSEKYAVLVNEEVKRQLDLLPRTQIAAEALKNSVCIINPIEKWGQIINEYAPEHLIVMGKYEKQINEVTNAGSVFLGPFTAESFGDYASGTNHTLPTAGFAKAYSGVSLDSFVKKVTYQRVEELGLRQLGPIVIEMAKAEELEAHAAAIQVRLNTLNEQ